MVRKCLNVISSILFIILISMILFNGVAINSDVTINDYTPKFELSKFPLESILYVETDSWSGSGVLIEPDLILTAGHVVGDAETLYVRVSDARGNFIASRSVFAYNVDLGLIWLDEDLPFPVVPLGVSSTLEIGETVYIIGYPWGVNTDIVTKGIVSGLEVWADGFFGKIHMLVLDAASQPGNSGGAVINSSGELIGILVGGQGYGDNFSIAVPIDIFKELYYGIIKEADNEAEFENICRVY